MPVALKQLANAIKPATHTSPWIHLVWFVAAGFFVSLLATTYGQDLSPGALLAYDKSAGVKSG